MRTRESLESLDKDKLIDKLLAEIDEKNRVEASLREAMAERDRMAMELIQITSIRPVALDSLESQAWRETIERAVENTGCMIYHAQLGPPWRKYRVTRNSVHMGFDPDTFSEALGADLPFYAPDMAAVFPVLAEGINQRALGVIWEYRVKVEGGLRWLRDYTCWRYADGQPLDYTGTCVDVTDLKVKAGESSPMTPVLVLKPSDWFFAPAMPVS